MVNNGLSFRCVLVSYILVVLLFGTDHDYNSSICVLGFTSINTATRRPTDRLLSLTLPKLREKRHESNHRRQLRQYQPPLVALQLLAPGQSSMDQSISSKAPSNTKLNALLPGGILNNAKEVELLCWITAFASSHIGMSAIRQTLITNIFGQFFANDLLGIVGNENFNLKLPDFWPGDCKGTNILFPDIETTGRQIYRFFYTMVSFVTLGTTFSIYLTLNSNNSSTDESSGIVILSYAVATLSGAFSLASLVNASPLGLMPSFRQKDDVDNDAQEKNTLASFLQASTSTVAAGDTILGITRDDDLKFNPKGLTRITRHPLILPVVPWGCATSILAGGRLADFVLFGGLSLYAIVGCYCQDLRVLREEGSVGTVFVFSDDDDHNDNSDNAEAPSTMNRKLKDFYDGTSFIPFQALIDGRQSWDMLAREFPILPYLLAIPSAFIIESILLRFLGVEYNII